MDEHNRYLHLQNSISPELFKNVSEARVLMVGAGGIGCELLKNLVLSGFKQIEIIDLDTIDLSNLNRQFLFHHEHIGQSKAEVAKSSIKRFDPSVHVTAHHGSILDSKFGPDFFSSFTIVLNALDNLTARRHVNRLCVATQTPLIESGTSGYLGQVQTIKHPETECYECEEKPTQKTFAYCTIRSSPKEPVHCVIWAKEEFKSEFGGEEGEKFEENMEDIELKKAVQKEKDLEKNSDYYEWLFYRLFYFSIFTKIRVAELTKEDFWEGKPPPTPLTFQDALKINTTQTVKGQVDDQTVWDLPTNCQKFKESTEKLKNRFQSSGFIKFDKDDKEVIQFITACSNIRSHIFSIPLQSQFSVKSLAGNIIPAIATTNAIIAGLLVIETFKFLENGLEKSRNIWLKKNPSAGRLLLATLPEKPKKSCYVCSSKSLSCKIDPKSVTLKKFIDKVLKKKLGFNAPTIILQSDLIYECGEGLDPEEEELYKKKKLKTLFNLGIEHNSILDIDDQSQTLKLKVTIIKTLLFEDEKFFEILGEVPMATELKTEKEEINPDYDAPVEIIEKKETHKLHVKRKAQDNDPRKLKKTKDEVIEL